MRRHILKHFEEEAAAQKDEAAAEVVTAVMSIEKDHLDKYYHLCGHQVIPLRYEVMQARRQQ